MLRQNHLRYLLLHHEGDVFQVWYTAQEVEHLCSLLWGRDAYRHSLDGVPSAHCQTLCPRPELSSGIGVVDSSTTSMLGCEFQTVEFVEQFFSIDVEEATRFE